MRDDVTLPFDFGWFLSQLSHVVYNPLMRVLYGIKYGNKDWSLGEMNAIILQQPVNQSIMVANNGSLLLQAIDEALVSATKNLLPCNEQQMLQLKDTCATKGLNDETAYLYMQGHCVYDLLERIGRFLMNRKDFKGLVLSNSLCLSGYDEIEHVQRDLLQQFH